MSGKVRAEKTKTKMREIFDQQIADGTGASSLKVIAELKSLYPDIIDQEIKEIVNYGLNSIFGRLIAASAITIARDKSLFEEGYPECTKVRTLHGKKVAYEYHSVMSLTPEKFFDNFIEPARKPKKDSEETKKPDLIKLLKKMKSENLSSLTVLEYLNRQDSFDN